MSGDIGYLNGGLGYGGRNISDSHASLISAREASFKSRELDEGLGLSVSAKAVFLKSEYLGQRVFAQSIEVSLSVSTHSVTGFDVPTPVQVASNVLGFVEDRLQGSVSQGANEEQIEGMMVLAREGVGKGFSQAIEDVGSLGLMSDELSEEISKSLAFVDEGLGVLEGQFLNEVRVDSSSVESLIEKEASLTSEVGKEAVEGSARSGLELNAFDFFQSREILKNESHKIPAVMSSRSFEGESSAFSLTTRDGDTVQIRFAQSEEAQYKTNGRGQQYQLAYSGVFEVDVQGDLDEGELAAINDLLNQVSEISNLFFEDRFQEAFESALNIGFDASEIADFSLDLAKAQYKEVRGYGMAGSDLHSETIDRYQPLVEVVNRFDGMFGLLSGFDNAFEEVRSLLIENVKADFGLKQGDKQQYVSQNELLEGFKDFVEGVFKSMQK